MKKKFINIDLVPNFESDDYQIIKNIFYGKYSEEDLKIAENEVLEILKNYFPKGKIYFFYSARSAITKILSILPPNSQVATQAFSCLVVPNAIKFAGHQPLLIDIDDAFNLDINDLKRKYNKNVKAIIIQNTFGIPANLEEIINFAKENNILIIENLAHAFGAKYNGIYLGNFGDITLLTFNRNKVISSIIGGALVINSENIKIDLSDFKKTKSIRQIALTGILLYRLKKNYNIFNKALIRIFRKFKITLEMISSVEKKGLKPENYFLDFPSQLFPLLLNQLKKLEKFNQHRQEIAKIYLNADLNDDFKKLKEVLIEKEKISEPIYLRFPFLSNKRDEIYEKLKKENIYLGDWYFCPLIPCVNNLEIFGYKKGCCPKTEEINKKILNLPTYIDIDKKTVLEILEKIKNA